MRVLVVAAPLVGHVLPLVPISRALQRAGADVVLATAEDGVPAARSAGLVTRDVAPRLRLGPLFLRLLMSRPRMAARETAGDAGTDVVGMLFAAVADRMADGVLALVDEWRPDLVLHEPLAAVGSVAAARCGAPVVLVEANLFDAEDLHRATTARLDRSRLRRSGLAELPSPAEVLLTAPPGLVGPRSGRRLRFVPVEGEAPPAELTRPGPRPRVIVSRSTVRDPRPDRIMRRVVRAAEDLDVEVVLARPDRRVARGPLPAHVRTTGWLSFPAVFPAAAGLVHHGGAGTVMTALAAGLPQVVVPGAGDRRVNADLVAARGAGLAVPTAGITAEVVERLVHDEDLRRAAREVADEVAAMPAPDDVAGEVLALAR